MSTSKKHHLTTGISALLALAVAHAAHADTSLTTTGTITIAGSTAFANFFNSPGSTNDFIDVNNDGISGFNANGNPFVQQLAPTPIISGGALTGYTTGSNINGASVVNQWSVQYNGVGSVNGLIELVNYNLAGTLPASTATGNPSNLNRTAVNGAGFSGPGGFPTNTPITSVDAAVLDVHTSWGVVGAAGTPAWNAKPTTPGYGQNTAVPVNATFQTNNLASLSYTNPSTGTTSSLNLNTAAPTSSTIFDTPLAFAPISFASNHGTGLQNITQSQIAFLYVTGRMPDGTNLVAATRDIGSGTRNGAMNSVGVDPSFGTGENIGNITNPNSVQEQVGAAFQPTNLDSTGSMTSVLKNDRLAVGYVSTTNGASDQAAGNYETLGVQFNLEGGTAFVRPTAASLVNNTDPNSAYRVGGTETIATVGDPNATFVNTNFPALTTNPQMANTAAAEYIRNITASLSSYTANPSSDSNTFMPVQSLVSSNFVPTAASQYIQDPANPTNWIPNPAFNAAVNTAAAAITGLNTGAYGSGSKAFGIVPVRATLASGTYSDGQTGAYRFYDSTGALQTLPANTALNARNAIEGDFNNTGVRNLNQIPQMMAAIANPQAWAMANNSGSAGSSLGNAAVPELLGDFNSDGNFDSSDIRYFADGLAIDPTTGLLNRKEGFTAVDNNWTVSTPGHPAGNYFNTTLATGKPYVAGDSRGDIAGSAAGPNAGGTPSGADGTINAKDIDYVWQQAHEAMGAGTDGSYSTLLTRAISDPTVNVRADLSADINGDMKIDSADITDLVVNILGTQFGDTNLDGVVNISDLNTVAANWQKAGTWATGDTNGDGIVNIADLNALAANWQFGAGSGSGSSASLTPAITSTPEPTSLAIVTLGILSLLNRRRKTNA